MVRKKRFTVQIQALTIQNQKTAGNSTVEKLPNEKTVETSLGGDEMKFNPRLYYHQKWFKPKYKNPLLRYLYEKEKQTPKKRNLKKDKIRDLLAIFNRRFGPTILFRSTPYFTSFITTPPQQA